MRLIKRHWGFLLGILFVCAVAYADSVGTFDALKLRPGTLPATGKNGELRVDSADSNKLKKYNESTTSWEEITGGGGGSGINYYADFQADTISNVTTFDDGGTLTDGTGGTVDYMSVTSETTVPLSGDASYKLVKGAANASGEGFSFDTGTPDITSTQGGETVYLTFNYLTASDYDNSSSGNQAKVYVYKTGNNTLEACNTRNVLSGTFTNELPVAPNGGQYQCAMTLTTGDTAVRVIIWWTGTGTNSTSILLDKIKVGPDATVTAGIVTEWQSFTMNIDATTTPPTKATSPSDDSAFYRRVGDSMQVTYHYEHTSSAGAAAGNGVYKFDLPSGCTIDSSKASTDSSGFAVFGSGHINTTAGGNKSGSVTYADNNSVFLITENGTVSSTTDALNNATVRYGLSFMVPCQEYANSNAILSTTQADHQTVRAIYEVSSSTSNSSFADQSFETIDYDTKIVDTHSAVTTGASWVFTAPRSGEYDVCSNISWANSTNLTRTILRAESSAGDQIRLINTSEVQASLGSFCTTFSLSKGETIDITGYQDDSASAARSIETSRSGDSRVRISISSRPSFQTFSTYGPYEYKEAECSTTATGATADVYADVTGCSIPVGPGTWEICYDGNHYHEWISGAAGSICKTAIRDSNNNDIDDSAKLSSVILDATYSSILIDVKSCSEVTTTTSETYKLSIKSASGSAGKICRVFTGNWTGGITDPDAEAKISARRMK